MTLDGDDVPGNHQHFPTEASRSVSGACEERKHAACAAFYSRAQFVEITDTLACDAGLGPSPL